MPLAPYLQPALIGLIAAHAAVSSWQRCLEAVARAWQYPCARQNIVPFPAKTIVEAHAYRRTAGGRLVPFKRYATARIR